MAAFNSQNRKKGKSRTDEVRSLDVRSLQRDGLLTPGRHFDSNWKINGKTVATIHIRTEVDQLIFNYLRQASDGDWKPMEYLVRLQWTECTYGGRRAWFMCPAQGCRRRVAKLYLDGGEIVACRHCNRLAYACQREEDDYRAMRQADKIRDRLGWGVGILNGRCGKPTGMHWSTFERLMARYDVFVGVALEGQAHWIRRQTRENERGQAK